MRDKSGTILCCDWRFLNGWGGARLFGGGFAERLRAMLEKKLHTPVELSVFAKSGLTTEEILQLFKRSDVRRAIAKADIITITGCGNDLVQAVQQYEEGGDEKKLLQASMHCQSNFSKMIQEIAQIKKAASAILRVFIEFI